MMKSLMRLMYRFRHPVSLPEEVATALGVQLSNFMSASEVLAYLATPQCTPTRLMRYMPREAAEAVFTSACRQERFGQHSLYSYCFEGNWMEFILQFDNQGRLRRLYVQHKDILEDRGLEISLRVTADADLIHKCAQ